MQSGSLKKKKKVSYTQVTLVTYFISGVVVDWLEYFSITHTHKQLKISNIAPAVCFNLYRCMAEMLNTLVFSIFYNKASDGIVCCKAIHRFNMLFFSSSPRVSKNCPINTSCGYKANSNRIHEDVVI